MDSVVYCGHYHNYFKAGAKLLYGLETQSQVMAHILANNRTINDAHRPGCGKGVDHRIEEYNRETKKRLNGGGSTVLSSH